MASVQMMEPTYNKLQYPKFESLKISTMTGIVQLNHCVNLEGAYCWLRLPLYMWQYGVYHKVTESIPWSGVAGTISSIRGGDLSRGYPRDTGPMKNSVTLYIDTTDKNVSIKVGPQKLHITGGKSREELIHATQLLLQQLEQAESDFRYCQNNHEQWAKVIGWFLQAVKGSTVMRQKTVFVTGKSDGPSMLVQKEDHHTVPIVITPSPELGLDQRMVDILTPLAREFQYFSDLYHHIYLMNMCATVIATPATPENPLTYTDLQLGMTNYNYHIGFNVDRLALASYVESHGFIVDYNNATNVGTKFLLPFQTNDTVIVHRKKKTKHTFMVYRGGQITQSSPNPELAQEAYNKFMNMVSAVYPYVQMQTQMIVSH